MLKCKNVKQSLIILISLVWLSFEFGDSYCLAKRSIIRLHLFSWEPGKSPVPQVGSSCFRLGICMDLGRYPCLGLCSVSRKMNKIFCC